MRKLLAYAACALMLMAPALGEADYSEYTLEELYALRETIDLQIARLESQEALPAYESGSYWVGKDIPAGVYLLVEKGYALFPSVLLREGAEEDSELISYDLVIQSAVVQLTDGLCATFTDVTAYPFESAPAYGLDENGAADEGGYWVGAQIPAGSYQITANDKAPLSSYSVYDGILGTDAQLLKFEVLNRSTEIVLEEGQYISLSGCSIAALNR